MPINTTNIDTKSWQTPSFEHLFKYDISEQKNILDNFLEAQRERIDQVSSLSKKLSSGLITKDQFDNEIKKIDKSIEKVYHRSPTAKIETGNNGETTSKHKNKLGFIFIGDTEKSENTELFNVNAPKITLAVGGALETTYNPQKNELAGVDPRKDFIPQASAQIHIISSADTDVYGIAGQSAFNNKSTIKLRADVLDIASNQAVLIRSLNPPYVSGVRSFSPGGVHIVSGQKEGGGDYKDPEPMVLGKSLADFLIQLVSRINEIVTIIKDINEGIISLKEVLATHVHDPVTLTSPEIIAYVGATSVVGDLKNNGNIYSVMLNLEAEKLNSLMALSENKFLSNFNRVN